MEDHRSSPPSSLGVNKLNNCWCFKGTARRPRNLLLLNRCCNSKK